jgi:hypothetical protein
MTTQESQEKGPVITVTARAVWRGSRPPKRQPRWITDLNGISKRTRLHSIERRSQFYATDLHQILDKPGLEIMFKWANKQMQQASGGAPAFLVQVVVGAVVPADISKYAVPRLTDAITLATWDVWSMAWKEGRYARGTVEKLQGRKA